jgi:hypothetical protein
MVGAGRPIVEGFSLQVAGGEHLTTEGVRAALSAWVERAFPALTVPVIALEHWTRPDGVLEELIELLMEPPGQDRAATDEQAPAEVFPDPSVAEPAYEDAA